MDTFSRRHGLNRPDADITVRYEAPDDLRHAVVALAYQCGLKPADLRGVLCSMLYRMPDRSNWSEFPNVDGESLRVRWRPFGLSQAGMAASLASCL